MLKRRDFIWAGIAFSALNAVSRSQILFGAKLPAYSIREVSPAFFNSLTDFGGKVLEAPGPSMLRSWIDSHTVSLRSEPQTFSEVFDPPFQFNSTESPDFTHVTRLPNRSMVINSLPHVVETTTMPGPKTSVNGPEMDALGDKSNPLLWRQYCGCLVHIPLNAEKRREHSSEEENHFFHWAADGGVKRSSQSLESRLNLSYARNFCTCEGIRLIGFGYTDSAALNPNRGQFGITQVTWA